MKYATVDCLFIATPSRRSYDDEHHDINRAQAETNFSEGYGYISGVMFHESNPQAVRDAAKASIGEMPPGEVSQRAQTAMATLNDQGQTDIAKELGDLLKSAQDNPVALKNAVIAFIEHHPDALAAFA